MSEKDLQLSQQQKNSNLSNDAWKVQKRAQLMTRSFDFSSYDEMRDFLDQLEALSEREDYYPDLTFSRTHVNVSIKSRSDELAQVDVDFSDQVDALINS